MSRFSTFRRHPKRTLSGLVAVLAAVAVAVGSGADFSASSSNTGNSVTAGTLSITNGTAGSILNLTGLKPSVAAPAQTVDIQNGGNISADFSLYRGTITDTPSSPALSGKLNLVISDCGLWTTNNTVAPSCSSPTQKYSGTLSGLNTSGTPLSLGTFAGGTASTSDKHRYQFVATLDSSADNTYQGGNSTVDLTWSATQH